MLKRHPLICLFVLVLAGACRSPQKQVAKQMDAVRLEWQTNIAHQAVLPEKALDWPSALAQMLAHNPKLRQARMEVTNSLEELKGTYRDLVPTLNLRSGVTKRLDSLNTTTVDDVTFSADSFFNVPGLVNFAARVYSAKLFYLRAQVASALAEREQTIDLFRAFYGVMETAEEIQKLSVQKATAKALEAIDPFTGHMMQTEMKLRELGNEKELTSLQQRISDLLGSRAFKWRLITNGLPELKYHEKPLPLRDTNRVAQLQMKLVAIELEGAKAQLLGIKMRYWPELNIFVSGPPVMQRNGGQTRYWDSAQVQGSADLYWNIDTRGYISRQLKQTKRYQELQMDRFRQESLALMDRLLFTQTLIDATREQSRRVDKQLAILLAVPPAQNWAALQKYAVDYRNLTQQQLRLRKEMSELNSLFWFMDEEAWPNQPKFTTKIWAEK